ncbi:MAG TPA: hypothetical protein VKZ54_12300 [Membranihabitans sp.]|nr:hypothetical protein [Membranihabitans sp.]
MNFLIDRAHAVLRGPGCWIMGHGTTMSLSATPVCALRAFGGWCAERTIRQIENERGERR